MLHGKKSSYYDVIHSMEFAECNEALIKVYNRIDMDKIMELIDETPLITDVQKRFYRHMIRARYEKIIRASYERLMKR